MDASINILIQIPKQMDDSEFVLWWEKQYPFACFLKLSGKNELIQYQVDLQHIAKSSKSKFTNDS